MYKDCDIEYILFLKSLMPTYSENAVDDIIRSKEDFQCFLYHLAAIINNEVAYFLLSEYSSFDLITPTLEIINKYRFEYKEKDIIDVCNQIISIFNRIKIMKEEEKEELLNRYITYQQDKRELEFVDGNEIIQSLVIDYYLYINEVDIIYKEEKFDNYELIYGSINYLLNNDEIPIDEILLSDIKYNLNYIKDNSKNRKLKKSIKVLEKRIKTEENNE